MKNRKHITTENLTTGLYVFFLVVFFSVYFFYLYYYNRYHIQHLEQIQLFRFSRDYFIHFLQRPGGLSEYISAFLVQFYLYPVIGAVIIILNGLAVFLLGRTFFKKFDINSFVWPLIPVLLLAALQSDHTYFHAFTIGITVCLVYLTAYVSIRNKYYRILLFGIPGWILLYLTAGSIAFMGAIACILFEVSFEKKNFLFPVLVYLFLMAAIPLTAWKYIFFIPIREAFLTFSLETFKPFTEYVLLILTAYYPFLIISKKIIFPRVNGMWFSPVPNWKNLFVSVLVITLLAGFIKKNAYDFKSELFLGIDNNVQKGEWDKALRYSSRFPEINPCAIFYTNLSLYKLGKLGDKLFCYRQIGSVGLFPDSGNNKFSPFFWCNIYYHFGHINEAYRVAFETLVTEGNSPRLLKQLTMASLINADYCVAKKYLNLLNESLFYKKWAKRYLKYIDHPELTEEDEEIMSKRKLLVHDDFFAASINFNNIKLLENHSENRMAFEYYMASRLLEKDILAFAGHLDYLKKLGYNRLPRHFEEALLFYIGLSKQDTIPENFNIRESTINRFRSYQETHFRYAANPEVQVRKLYQSFGNTYWFYHHFFQKNALKMGKE